MNLDDEDVKRIAEEVASVINDSEEEEVELGREAGIPRPNYEFEPVPTQVLYDSRDRAMERARNIGLEGVHTHKLGNNRTYYMPGDTHSRWIDFVQGRRGSNVRPDEDKPIDKDDSTTRNAKEIFSSHKREDDSEEDQEDDNTIRTEPATIHEVVSEEDSSDEEPE